MNSENLLLLQLNWGGDIPEELFLTNLTETSKEDMEKVLVGRGSTHRVEVEVEEPGTVIRSKGGTGGNRLISCHDCISCFFL